MRSVHPFVSPKPVSSDPTLVGSNNWNDVHPNLAVPSNYSANGTVPTSVDYIRATGGAGGIALQLTAGATPINGASGNVTGYQVYFAKKVDSGAGAITFTDSLGALFEDGQSSYQLTLPGQWAIFIWNGTVWEVFGGQRS